MIKGLILNYNYKDSFTDRDKKTHSVTKNGKSNAEDCNVERCIARILKILGNSRKIYSSCTN